MADSLMEPQSVSGTGQGVTKPFMFAGGIENTFIDAPHPVTGRRLEEYELIGHYERCRDDLDLVASCGIDTLRWGIPWYRVNPKPSVFDWGFVDEAIDHMLDDIGLSPIIDLLHYGTPAWLENSFLDAAFQNSYLAYVDAFCERYGDKVGMATPVNEPWTTAEFCGRRGDWPPYLRDDEGFARILVALAQAAARASHLLKSAGIDVVHVEVAGDHVALDPDAEQFAEHRNDELCLYWDLITARVDDKHPLHRWLVANGVADGSLVDLLHAPAAIDVIGINFYPQWAVQLVMSRTDGSPEMTALQSDARMLERLLCRYAACYGKPVMLTETSAYGPAWRQSEWLKQSIQTCLHLRSAGVPVVGHTWFPMIDMIDWEYRNGRGEPEEYIIGLGLWDLNRKPKPSAIVCQLAIRRGRKELEIVTET